MEPTDQELYDQLVGYLAAEGEVEEDLDAGVLTITAFEHRPIDPPMRLHLSPSAFGQHLRDAAPDSALAFPDVPPIEAAWQLFTIHIMEGVHTAKPGETELVPDRTGVSAKRPDELDSS